MIELTKAYLSSSYVFEPKEDIFFDKHSTGGVGDKVSIALLPLLGSLGMKSLKFSGRGLGFTGGTLDKLEALKGFKVELSKEEINSIIDKTGIAILSTTDDIVPADKKIYALRDVTCTVGSLPLIAASIMSKKIVSGSKYILIDLKVGTGAFMETLEEATELGRLMKLVGEAFDKKVFIAFTTMNQPLGRMIGNGNEIIEVKEILSGKGPEDAHNLIVKLASEIYSSLNKITLKEAEKKVLNAMNDGSALNKLEE
jgi:pyrimidine-nucleoside phosphorylase